MHSCSVDVFCGLSVVFHPEKPSFVLKIHICHHRCTFLILDYLIVPPLLFCADFVPIWRRFVRLLLPMIASVVCRIQIRKTYTYCLLIHWWYWLEDTQVEIWLILPIHLQSSIRLVSCSFWLVMPPPMSSYLEFISIYPHFVNIEYWWRPSWSLLFLMIILMINFTHPSSISHQTWCLLIMSADATIHVIIFKIYLDLSTLFEHRYWWRPFLNFVDFDNDL